MNNTPTILVISDSHDQFAATASLLRNEGYDVRFENNVSSMMLDGGGPPHLIISELAAPNVDGLKLCRRMQKDHDLGTTPVLLVGDLSLSSSIVEDSFRCGAVNYLQRPIDPLRLVDICRGILQPSPECTETSNDGSNNIVSSFDAILRNEPLRTALFDNSRLGLAIFSATGELVKGNAALKSMLDHTEDELCGMTLSDFFYPHDLESGKRALTEILAGKGNYYRAPNGYLTPIGDRVWGDLTIVAVTEADTGSRLLIGIFDDPRQEQPTTVILDPCAQDHDPTILDLTKWKINKGLICCN